MAGVSNGKYLPLLPAAPAPGTGWSVAVISHLDFVDYARGRTVKPLAVLYRFQSLTWSPELSDVGAGSLTLLASDPVLRNALSDGREGTALYTYDNLFVVYQDGQWRGEWIGTRVERPEISVDGAITKTIKISGPGTAQTLAWADVFSPYYPKPTPKDKNGFYVYKNLPVMASWIDLLGAAQRRGSVPWVHLKFNTVKDSGGQVWEDTVPKPPSNVGSTVLGDVLFTTDSSALTTAGTKAVAAMAKKIAPISYPYVSLVGHTDSRGTKAHNQQLGLNRANTVRNALLAIKPLPNVLATSKGETQPIASNRTAAGQSKNRRVQATYTTSVPIPDTLFRPDEGTNLLDLLKALTSGQTTAGLRGPIKCEWLMKKGFQLHVQSQRIAADRSKTAVFHEGSTYLTTSTTTYDRSELANLVAARNDYGIYKVAVSAASRKRWHQREQYLRIEGAYTDKLHAAIAAQTLEASKDPVIQSTVTIQAGEGRTPFADFALGDWIGLVRRHGAKPSTIDRQRVVAISVQVDADGVADYEIALTGIKQTRVAYLRANVDALINKKHGIRSYISDDQPTGGAPGDFWTPQSRISI